jgi:hypothetical protein
MKTWRISSHNSLSHGKRCNFVTGKRCIGGASEKKKRMAKQYEKIRKSVADLKKDNRKGMTYESEMMVPGGEEDEEQEGRQEQQPAGVSQRRPCRHCESTSYSGKSSLDCPANPRHKREIYMWMTCVFFFLSKSSHEPLTERAGIIRTET